MRTVSDDLISREARMARKVFRGSYSPAIEAIDYLGQPLLAAQRDTPAAMNDGNLDCPRMLAAVLLSQKCYSDDVRQRVSKLLEMLLQLGRQGDSQ